METIEALSMAADNPNFPPWLRTACKEGATEIERRFGIGSELIIARRERDELRAEIERLRAVVNAAQEWSVDRAVRDWGDADLMKALWTFNGDNTEPCPECDGECGEPCAPCTVAEAHAAIDATLDDLVKRGKLYRGEPIHGLVHGSKSFQQGGNDGTH